MRADAGIKAHTVDDSLGVKALHFGISIQFIEVAHTKGEVGIGE